LRRGLLGRACEHRASSGEHQRARTNIARILGESIAGHAAIVCPRRDHSPVRRTFLERGRAGRSSICRPRRFANAAATTFSLELEPSGKPAGPTSTQDAPPHFTPSLRRAPYRGRMAAGTDTLGYSRAKAMLAALFPPNTPPGRRAATKWHNQNHHLTFT
jgi:hypothetical protein